jgi:hypothetical protein
MNYHVARVALDEKGKPVKVSPDGSDEQNIILWMDHRYLYLSISSSFPPSPLPSPSHPHPTLTYLKYLRRAIEQAKKINATKHPVLQYPADTFRYRLYIIIFVFDLTVYMLEGRYRLKWKPRNFCGSKKTLLKLGIELLFS